jgi:Na+/alanine symporter
MAVIVPRMPYSPSQGLGAKSIVAHVAAVARAASAVAATDAACDCSAVATATAVAVLLAKHWCRADVPPKQLDRDLDLALVDSSHS